MKRINLICSVVILLAIVLLPAKVLAALPTGVPGILDAPGIEKVELITENVNKPIFRLQIKLSQSVLDLDAKRPADGITNIEYYSKVDDGEWEKTDGGYMDNLIHEPSFKVPGKANTFYVLVYALHQGDLAAVDLNNHTYYFKAQLNYGYHSDGDGGYDYICSEFSNVISVGKNGVSVKPGDWSAASTWALPELQKARDSGLLPGILKGSDMTKPITREEFCELAVMLYEKSTRSLTEAVTPNPFKDTTNLQVLKAYKLGITEGTSATAFEPNIALNREQMATILYRTIKVIAPNGNYYTTSAKAFTDQIYISSWAVDGAKYMSGKEIIKGDINGNFMPKVTATREMAIAMTVRTYGIVPQFAIPDDTIVSNTPEHPSQARLKLPAAFPNEIPFTDDAVIQQIVDDSDAENFPSITLGYTSNKTLSQIKAMYKEFLKNDTEIAEQDMGNMYMLTGHISNYELNVLYLNGQTHLTVTFE